MTDEEWKVQRQQASKRLAVQALHSTGFATNAGNATKSIVELTPLREALRKQWTDNAEFDRITDRQTQIDKQRLPTTSYRSQCLSP
jgi:predicted ATPase